ncbi:MAG: hypothetical protein MZV65_40565 [Chromatiales bacterium]|nr:hypothetical protein [Chromatiales bacterium]
MISRELALALRVSQAQDGSLTPADLMRMSLDVCGGDYPSATLTAHNFLKEIAYSGRGGGLQAAFMYVEPFPGKDEAARLMNKNILSEWRGRMKDTPFDVYDMGEHFVVRLNPGARSLPPSWPTRGWRGRPASSRQDGAPGITPSVSSFSQLRG